MNDPNKAIDFIIKHGAEFAKAKSDRVYLELYRKTKKAQLMLDCESKTVAEKEAYAYAHPEMIELIGQLRDAVDKEEALRALIDAAKLRIEVWKATTYTDRRTDKVLE
jgi:hypothetical protein